MSSIISGYNYDIFISYRQKDNKGDRWVSEFVEALKTELESTFKEEISVYFDINLVDPLLKLNPDNYAYLHTKGWGLYKQGKYEEAEYILQNSWVLRMEKAIYDHAAWLHLDAAKKAVDEQMKN